MKLRHIGYACINTQLDTTTNRTFRLARLSEQAIQETAALNFAALKQILEWNIEHNIRLFRIGTSIIPYASHKQFSFDWEHAFASELDEIRTMVQQNNLRLSMHPGQYTVLNSPNPVTLQNAVRELEWQSRLVERLDPEQGVVVLHVGGAYGNKPKAIEQFATNYEQHLGPIVKRRLVVENDDVTFNLEDVLHLSSLIDVPIIFDILHHKANHEGTDWQIGLTDQLVEVVRTWKGKVPKIHLSSPKTGSTTSHADYIDQSDFDELIHWMESVHTDEFFDLMIEAKLKDKAVQALSCELFSQPAILTSVDEG